MRVHIHENPELSLHEYNTCALLEDYVKKNVKYDRLKRVGDTGLFFELKGTKPGNGPTIVFRGDIDALPIQEDERMSPAARCRVLCTLAVTMSTAPSMWVLPRS